MTSNEWGILIGIIVTAALPLAGGWIAIWVRLAMILYQLGELQKGRAEILEQIKELWSVHNHQEGRLYTQDRVIAAMLNKMDIDASSIDYAPKNKPHIHDNPNT